MSAPGLPPGPPNLIIPPPPSSIPSNLPGLPHGIPLSLPPSSTFPTMSTVPTIQPQLPPNPPPHAPPPPGTPSLTAPAPALPNQNILTSQNTPLPGAPPLRMQQQNQQMFSHPHSNIPPPPAPPEHPRPMSTLNQHSNMSSSSSSMHHIGTVMSTDDSSTTSMSSSQSYPQFPNDQDMQDPADATKREKLDTSNMFTTPTIKQMIQSQQKRDAKKIEKKMASRSNRRRKRGPEPANSPLYYFRMNALDEVASKYVEMSPTDVIELVQKKWETLQDEQKEKYVKMAQDDQERYNNEVKKYLPKSEGGTMKRQKRKKHPKAPKHPMSAYLYFVKDYRPKIKTENPDKSFTDIAKLLGEKWKTITGKEREKYNEKADLDKKRYRAEKLAFEPGPVNLENGKKRKKHPLAPKHPLSAYLYFVASNRADFNAKFPDKDFTEVAKLLGEHWKNLPETQKRRYRILAAADKKRYEEEKEKWHPPDHEKEVHGGLGYPGDYIYAEDETIRLPKKALTAYSFWAFDERAKVLQLNPNIDKRELTRQLRARWNQLPAEHKQVYNEQAESDRERYQSELEQLPRRFRPQYSNPLRRQRRQERLMRVPREVLEWTHDDVGRFIEAIGLPDQISAKFITMCINGQAFVRLTNTKLAEQLLIQSIADRKRIARAISLLCL